MSNPMKPCPWCKALNDAGNTSCHKCGNTMWGKPEEPADVEGKTVSVPVDEFEDFMVMINNGMGNREAFVLQLNEWRIEYTAGQAQALLKEVKDD